MTISNEAVEAAAKAMAQTCDPLADWERQGDAYQNIYRRRVMHTLKAVTPIIRAEALNSAADDAETAGIGVVTPSSLRARAAAERGDHD